jgi:hypothetical protein
MIVDLFHPGTLMMFKHMNKVVIDRYKLQSIMPNDLHLHKDRFEQIHGVRVILENSRWTALEFSNEHDYLIAMLKWR